MNRHLPDVNVLLALVWPRHESHAAAHEWFQKFGRHAWATNALTQLGVLRLLTNPAVTQGAVSAATALRVVREATQHAGHEYWPLDREILSGLELIAPRLTGHRQWTDAMLLGLARKRDGIFVTFDSGVKELAVAELKNCLLVLKSPR
jgi:uncharacterized protein